MRGETFQEAFGGLSQSLGRTGQVYGSISDRFRDANRNVSTIGRVMRAGRNFAIENINRVNPLINNRLQELGETRSMEDLTKSLDDLKRQMEIERREKKKESQKQDTSQNQLTKQLQKVEENISAPVTSGGGGTSKEVY